MELPTNAKAPLAEGDIVAGRYRICGVLGEGGSGVVYVAEALQDQLGSTEVTSSIDTVTVSAHQRVALKVIHRHLLGNHQINRRFHREARILSKLRCPNLAALLDFGETEGRLLFMALELVDGPTLDQVLRDGALEVERAASIAAQLCVALDEAHAAGVVHRDLKPGNVIIQSGTDGEEQVKVLDFGMAKMLRGELSDSLNALTEQNMVLGTPEYMAPEQARGEQADERTDVYAVGVMLYEMLTGSVPFRSNTPIGMMTAHLVEEPEPPSSRAPRQGIAPAVEAVVMHALAKNPADRYPSAADLGAALRRALCRPSDVTSTAPPPAPEYDDLATRATEDALRTPALRPTEPSSLEPPSVPATQPSDRPSRLWIVVAIIAALLGVAMGIIMSMVGAA